MKTKPKTTLEMKRDYSNCVTTLQVVRMSPRLKVGQRAENTQEGESSYVFCNKGLYEKLRDILYL